MPHHVPAPHRRCWPFLLALTATLAPTACGGSDDAAQASTAQNATAQWALLETTDLHYYARSYNYYADKKDQAVGLERTATLIRQARSEYPYDNNTIHAVKVTGAQIKLWLENAANRFNQIDPNKAEDQWLLNDSKTGLQPGASFPGYNFDMFTTPDISYEIDVTQARYHVNAPATGGERIRNLRYKGLPIDIAQQFIVATNNYRANSSAPFILGTGKAFDIVWASPDANRQVVLNYVKAKKTITRAGNGLSSSWRFAKVATKGKVLFKSAPNELAVAQAAGLSNISLDRADDSGVNGGDGSYSVYRIALDQ